MWPKLARSPLSDASANPARVAIVCATAIAVLAVWLATASAVSTGVAFFFAIPVGLVTWWWGLRAGALAGLAAVVVYALGAQIQDVPHFVPALLLRAAAFAGVIAIVALLRERLILLEGSAEELEAIRTALAPTELPRLAGLDAAAAFVPSEYGVSGDFYLLTNGPDGSALAIVGDVSGHGPRAARLATFLRARFAALAASISDPAELLALVNAGLLEQPRRLLVSAVCVRFQPRDARLTWATAGHPPPLRLPQLEELAPDGSTYLLGAEAGLALRNCETPLSAGQGVVLYTDGATEVRRGGEMLGVDGLLRLLEPLVGLPAEAIVRRTEKAIRDWTELPIRDDLCLLAMKPA
jgi:serine phosphatase RsbU (regulator of sigma subunit)